MIGVEKQGCPTVTLVAEHFVKDARKSADIFGLHELPLGIVDGTFTNRTPEAIQEMISLVMPQIEAALTTALDVRVEADTAPARREVVDGEDLLDCLERFNRLLIERGWSDGLPLVPPTPRAVDRMLAACPLSRQTAVVSALYPGLGIATVEKIAVNGVMAGCHPEHMPVLLALVRAYEGLGILGRTQAISTGPNAPMVLLSGPIVKQLGFNFGTCVVGPGSPSYANTVVGRAMRLILMNIGQAYPGTMDMDTIGTPNKYSFCLAENEDACPWPTWNAQHGFDSDTSTLSIALVYPGPDIYDITATRPEEMLDTLATLTGSYIGTASTGRWLFGGRQDPVTKRVLRERHVLLLAPAHAALMARQGWSLADVQGYLYQRSRIPFGRLCSNLIRPQSEALKAARPELMWLLDQPETKVGIAESPECFDVFVTGGEGGRSQFYYGGSEISTVAIDEF